VTARDLGFVGVREVRGRRSSAAGIIVRRKDLGAEGGGRGRVASVTTVYQPADRYWTFQWLEAAIFVGVAPALIGLAYWWLRRRLS